MEFPIAKSRLIILHLSTTIPRVPWNILIRETSHFCYIKPYFPFLTVFSSMASSMASQVHAFKYKFDEATSFQLCGLKQGRDCSHLRKNSGSLARKYALGAVM